MNIRRWGVGLLLAGLSLSACMQSLGPGGVQQSAGPFQQSVGPGGVSQSAGPFGSQSIGPGGIQQSAGPFQQSVGSGGVQQRAGGTSAGNSCQISCGGRRYSASCPTSEMPVCQCDREPQARCAR